jgi:DNA invertase Pin-like site-specific DNA recombinase
MSKIGYARVSTADQELDIQVDRLRAEGCSIIRSEKVSGASRGGRTELATILEFMRPGDELVVLRLDRLGRDTRDVLNIVHELRERGAFLTVLEPYVTTRGETGEIVLTVLGMVAKMERQFIKERQKAGIEKAKAEGVYQGRPITLDHARIKDLHTQGVGATEIARQVGCSRGAVYKALAVA